MVPPDRKRLLVEGSDDCYVVVELIKPKVPWTRDNQPVQIVECGGARLLNEDTIPLWLKASNTEILGVVVDANGNCAGRWQRIRQLAGDYVPGLPLAIPEEGLILPTARATKFGVWIMPDNKSSGMLETFLEKLVPAQLGPLLDFARRATADAKSHGANYQQEHTQKAIVHCWLAWMDPPGKPFGIALRERFFDANAAAASAFQSWFRNLYEL